jgi:DNA-binding NtrC family response regulator
VGEEQRTELKKRTFAVASRLRVWVESGPDAGRMVEPDGGSVTIGTSTDNDLVLSDATVSRYHLELTKTDDGIALVDLGSRNGTFAGPVRIERGVIGPGARLAIGSSVIAIEDGGRAMRAPAGDRPVPGVVGDSEAMSRVRDHIHALAGVPTSVLIQGETGVGKEVIARALHDAGPRAQAPFVVVDCGSMPATLIASQLFGHEKGAFTGAAAGRKGAFERAAGGTVLLDEIGELPLDVQPSLLGVLERRRFVRVGGEREITVEARVLAATNRDLRTEVNRGSFRSDLYFRLAVARIVIPPLRERPEDVAPLVAHFCEQLAGAPEVPATIVAALPALARQPLAGNARELRNIVEGALVMGEIALEAGSGELPAIEAPAPTVPYREARSRVLEQFERDYLGALIEAAGGNASEAARRAKMDRPYLLTLLRRHGLR